MSEGDQLRYWADSGKEKALKRVDKAAIVNSVRKLGIRNLLMKILDKIARLQSKEMWRMPMALLPIALLAAGCFAGTRYTPPTSDSVAEISVTANRQVANLWVRILRDGCNFENSQVVGAIHNKTIGWEPTGDTLRFSVSAGRRITIGMHGNVVDKWLDDEGVSKGAKYSHCYPTATFEVREGHHYLVDQRSIIEGDKAWCGFNIVETSPYGSESQVVEFELGKCENSPSI